MTIYALNLKRGDNHVSIMRLKDLDSSSLCRILVHTESMDSTSMAD